MGTKRPAYKDLSLDQLRNFCEVIRCGGYSEASRNLGLSATTVWEQVRALERHFEVTLLKRSGRNVEATLEAHRLVEMIQPMLASLDSAKEVLRQNSGIPPERITLVAAPRMLMEEVTPAIREFQKTFPSIRVEIQHSGSERPEALVLNDQADVAITVEPPPHATTEKGVEYEIAYQIEYLLITPPGHSLIEKKSLRLADIVQYPLVMRRPEASARRRIQEVLHQHNLVRSMTVAVETSSSAFSLACVRAGLGIAIIAGNPNGMLCQGLGVRSVRKWFGNASLVFVWKRGAHRPPAVNELVRLIRSTVDGR